MSRPRNRKPGPRIVVALLLGALVAGSGSALASHTDPQKRLTKVDNARARAMLVKLADLPRGFQARPVSGEEPHFDCRALNGADLTLTGEADGKVFGLGLSFVESAAQVYKTVADANAAWRRSISGAGTRCLTDTLRQEYAKQGLRLMSFRKLTFPRVSQRTVAYRLEVAANGAQGSVPLYLDLIASMNSRAHASFLVGSALSPPPRAEELRLARLTAKRMATAMRGA